MTGMRTAGKPTGAAMIESNDNRRPMSPLGQKLFDQATADIKKRMRDLKKPVITERISRPSKGESGDPRKKVAAITQPKEITP